MTEKHLPSAGTLQYPQQSGLARAKAGSLEFYLGLPDGWQVPSIEASTDVSQDAIAQSWVRKEALR